jgi:carboxymethylenebutenolidase
VDVTERRVDLRTADGVMDTYVFQPSGSGQWPAVIMYMDAMAVRPELKEMAKRLAANGYVAVLPNLFYRSGPIAPVDPAAFVTPGPERDRVFGLIQSIDGPKVMSDTKAILEHLATQATSVRSTVGTVGYCMGGGYALLAAGTFPDRVGAAASFHGAALATSKPDSPHLVASAIKGKVYIAVAGIDPMFSDEQRERIRSALAHAGVDFRLEVYPDVRHGFTVTGHPVYDAAGSERHWREMLTLFSDALS